MLAGGVCSPESCFLRPAVTSQKPAVPPAHERFGRLEMSFFQGHKQTPIHLRCRFYHLQVFKPA